MKQITIYALLVILMLMPTFAQTAEVSSLVTTEAKTTNFLTEFDITFWQTMPFASFWGYVIASQLARGGEVNWLPIVSLAVVVSATNAFFHARRVTK